MLQYVASCLAINVFASHVSASEFIFLACVILSDDPKQVNVHVSSPDSATQALWS